MVQYTNISVEDTFSRLATTHSGLSEQEAARRLEQTGPNCLKLRPPTSAWKIFINQFGNFIIYLLLFAVVFSIIIGEYMDSLVILAILIMNSLLGFYQEYKANRSLEKLISMVQVEATVFRDGKIRTINAEELVCGDIIQIEGGDKIPADARLIDATLLQIDESVLTGESKAVEKQTAALEGTPTTGDQTNMVFVPSTVTAGRGRAVVTGCGMDTEIGRISEMVADTEQKKTPLQRRLDAFGKRLGIVIIIICLLVFTLSLIRINLSVMPLTINTFLDFAFIAISLAVAAVPTALPAVVTIALSIGTRRLLKKKMLVRKLTSVETLGSCDVVCSDKTGTLTRNEMTVTGCWSLSGKVDLAADDITSGLQATPDLEAILTIGTACNNSHLLGIKSSPTEKALKESAEKAGVTFSGKRLGETPFDSQRKLMSVLVEEDGDLYLYVKGAPDRLVERCTQSLVDGGIVDITEEQMARIEAKNSEYASQAMRVIAFAFKKVDSVEDQQEDELVFAGLQAMHDPPRRDVSHSICRAREAHIRVVMITGDHKETATAIAEQIGIYGDSITGRELNDLSDDQLRQQLETVNIFARVVPEHKHRIVKSLQERGHVVAMTGDGVNDAPALKKADIGIAVGSGTDVAKEASDFVLLDDSFTSIIDGVEEGRGIYDNIQKSIMLLLSGNLMEVLVIFLAVLLGFNLPLTAVLLLWINLVTDGAPALAYTVDPYGKNVMTRPPIPIRQSILPKPQLTLLASLGCTGALIGLALFQWTGGNSGPEQLMRSQTLVFNFIVLYEMVLVYIIRHNYQVRLFSNPSLWLAVLFSVLIQGILMYTPLHYIFRIVPLSGADLMLLFSATALFGIASLFMVAIVRRIPHLS